MEIPEKPKRTRKPKELTAFDEEKAKLKKTLKKKPLKDDEEPLEFDLPVGITNESSGLFVNSQTLKLPDAPFLDSISAQPTTQSKSEPIPIKLVITHQTPPTPQNSYKTPVRNFILHNEYIY